MATQQHSCGGSAGKAAHRRAGADQPARRSLDIDAVQTPLGHRRVISRDEPGSPFHGLVSFRLAETARRRRVLLVPPLSGHFPLLMRDVVLGLVPDFDVILMDWTNVRHVPLRHGDFGFDDNIRAIEGAIRDLGPDLSVLALCQGGVPALAATARLAETEAARAPAALVLMAAPIDPLANPTAVVRLIRRFPMAWFRTVPLERVPRGFAGEGRSVYPAHAQLAALQTYLERQREAAGELARKMARDDGADPACAPFDDLYTSIMDIEGRHYVENIERVFHARDLMRGRLVCAGATVRPEAIAATSLMTIEGARDDIAAPGQTAAALDLCPAIPETRRARLVVPDCGHFGLFHGEPWRSRVLPEVRAFLTRRD